MYHFRIRAMLIVIFGAFLMVVTRLFYLQILEGPRYREYAENVRLSSHTLPTLRGRIVSADGVPLAADLPAYDIGVRYDQIDPLVKGSRWRTVLLGWIKALAAVDRGEKLKAIRELEVTVVAAEGGRVARVSFEAVIARPERRPGVLGRFLQPRDVVYVEERRGEIEVPPQVTDRTRNLARVTAQPLERLLAAIVEAGVEIVRERAAARELVTIVKDVDYPLVRTIECRSDLFEGFGATRRPARAYPCGPLACHTIGYLTVATDDDLRAHGEAYHGDRAKRLLLGDELGRTGLEAHYDAALRGRRGYELAEVDYLHRRQSTLECTSAQPGHDLHLTLDTRWQRAAEHALLHAATTVGCVSTSGAVVVLDVRSGAVLAIAAHPGYDLNRFRRDFATLNDRARSPDRPLFHRAISPPNALPMGSVFKIVGAIAATNAGMSPSQTSECTGSYELGGRVWRCHAHWTVDLEGAIRQSCNVYFWEAAMRTGAERLADQARALGLGAKTGIDLPAEHAGCVPSPRQRWTESQTRWHGGDTLNLAIGQGDLQATPLQVARMMAAVANGGQVLRPHLKDKLVAASGAVVEPPQPADAWRQGVVEVSPMALEAIRRGMTGVTTQPQGTAYAAFRGFGRFLVAGKTGTAQGPRDNIGWFAGFAPADEPQVAFAVMVEHLGPDHTGGGTAAQVARVLFDTVPADLMPGEPTNPLMPLDPAVAQGNEQGR